MLKQKKKIQSNFMTFVDIKNYEKIGKIGQGGFGEVFKVKDKETGNLYAAKVSIDEVDKNSKELLDNISGEIDIFSKLNHPSILKFVGFSPKDYNNNLYPVILTEYASNGCILILILFI